MTDPATLPASVSESSPDLSDALGPIPPAPPVVRDDQGRLVLLSAQQRKAQAEAAARAIRAMRAMRAMPDDDPPGVEAEMMRGIDSRRPEGRKLFEGIS